MFKVLITGKIHDSGLEIFNKCPEIDLNNKPDLPYEEILKIISEYDCIVTRSETRIDPELINAGKKLKVIARAAVGIENIDVPYATENGILVINTPGQNTNSAAELTMALLLASTRNIITAHQKMKSGGWDRHKFTGIELLNKTIGIIGLGNVGHRVAKFAKGFDMTVLAYDPYIADHRFDELGAKKVDLDYLLSESDVVTLHVPKVKETIKMLSTEEFKKMKDGVHIVNAARGGIIDEDAMVEALKSGKIKSACLDTFEIEPFINEKIKELDNVILTPHIGASTQEAQVRIAKTVADQTIKGLKGEVVDTPINMPRVQFLENSPVKAYTVLAEKLGCLAGVLSDFNPDKITFQYRGELAAEETSFINISFLKGFLGKTTDYPVTFVNAEKMAVDKGIRICHENDEDFSAYNSALKVTVSKLGESITVGGIVFDNKFQRVTLVNEFYFEIEPKGRLIIIRNKDMPGVVGNVGACLGQNGVNIQQMELSRNRKGGEAMFMILVDDDVNSSLLEDLSKVPNVIDARSIVY